jgi:hypothetical protein
MDSKILPCLTLVQHVIKKNLYIYQLSLLMVDKRDHRQNFYCQSTEITVSEKHQ